MKKRILYVEPNADSRLFMEIFLEIYGYDVISVATAEEALRLIRTQCFDAYLLDNWIPRIGGIELCHYILLNCAGAVILIYSGAAYAADIEEGFQAGAQAYLIKPTGFTLLPNTLESLLSEKELPKAG
jgi:DNA-binding response OmpR family regulator